MIWRIWKYKCDEQGVPYGDLVCSMCYSQELMQTYKNPKYVEKIEVQEDDNKFVTIWEKR